MGSAAESSMRRSCPPAIEIASIDRNSRFSLWMQKTGGMTKRWWNRVAASVALCLGGALLLTACLPPGIACTTIGYISTVDVHVEGDVAFIDACAGSECGSSAFTISELASGNWSIQFLSGHPDELTLQAYGTGGVLLAEEEFELVWTPVGDSGPCPGPVETPPLEFSVE